MSDPARTMPWKGLISITVWFSFSDDTPLPTFSTIPTPSLPATAGKAKPAGFLPET